MDGRNQQVLALAFRKAKAKSLKCKDLLVEPDMDNDAVDALIVYLCKIKATESGKPWETFVKGQRWYIEDLKAFSELDATARLDHEYKAAFPDVASEDEMLLELERLV